MSPMYVIARNHRGRPTLQHKLLNKSVQETACGRDISAWSRSYSRQPIEAILCKLPACRNY